MTNASNEHFGTVESVPDADTTRAEPASLEVPSEAETVRTEEEAGETVVSRKEKKSRSGWLAAGLALVLVAWMGSGFLWPAEPEPEPERVALSERAPVSVEVVASRARSVTDYLVSDGQAVPDRVTVLRAEAGGNVEAISVAKGDRVETGQVLATIESADRDASEATAQAELARARRDFDSVKSLADRGYATRQRLDQARVAVTAAEAQVAQAARGQSDTTINAPFAGVLDEFDLEAGQVIAAGAEIGTLVDADPLKIEIKVPQQAVRSIRAGKTAEITFITGENRTGTVTYVSSNANTATRTFTAEVKVDNTDGIPAGISAQVRIPTSEAKAHFVSPATLSLGADGTLGIKTAEADDTVGFYPVDVVRAETKGVWVSGLPDEASVITVGQGFVDRGEKVMPTLREPDVATPPTDTEPTDSAPAESEPADSAPAASVAAAPAGEPASQTEIAAIEPVASEPTPKPEPLTNAVSSEPDVVAPEAVAIPDAPFDTAKEIADMTAAVRTVQERLNTMGYDVGLADGIPGARTVEGIREFQRDLKLDADGKITFDLLDALAEAVKDRS